MADSKHTGIMGNTWSTTFEKGRKRKRRVGGQLVDILYGAYNHYYYYGRHAVDDNNNNRQGTLPFEETYAAKRWDLRQFGFIIALAMTNAHLAFNYFVKHKQGQDTWCKAEFMRQLARDLVHFNMTENAEGDGVTLRSASSLPTGCTLATKKNKYVRGGHKLCRLGSNRG